MVLNSADIKKQIIKTILEFSLNLDVHKRSGEYSIEQISEMLSLAIEINNLINFLDIDTTKTQIKKPNLPINELKKMKRALELTFKYDSDLNSVAIDIGENLSTANRLIQRGIDYILENISKKDHKQHSTVTTAKKAQTGPKTNTARRTVSQQPRKKKSGVGPFSFLLFLAILGMMTMFVYDTFFNQHATRVATLVKEYRSDRDLSSVKRPVVSTELKVYGTKALLNIFLDSQTYFSQIYPGIKYDIKGEDSGIAIQELIEGKIALASSSKIPTIEDRRLAAEKKRPLADHRIALDSVVFFVNKANSIESLSLEDIRKIYQAQSPSWTDFLVSPGTGQAITRISLSKESGTYSFFQDRVMMGDEVSTKVNHIATPEQMIDMVRANPGAIGFCSVSALIGRRDVKILKISSVLDKEGTKPIDASGNLSADLVRRGDYPLTRYLYIISAGELSDSQAKFIDFMRSPEAQAKLADYGLVNIN